MERKLFTVVFTNNNIEEVYAFSRDEAITLAQGEQIRKGNTYMVFIVKDSFTGAVV